MKRFKQFITMTAIVLVLGSHAMAIPTEMSKNITVEAKTSTVQEIKQSENVVKAPVNSTLTKKTEKDSEQSNSNQQPTFLLPPGTGPASYDPAAYAGYLTPEAFQQYLQQFASVFSPYAYPGYAPAPAYPSPYTVQKGYDGFLIPTPGATSLSASGSLSSNGGNGIITALANLIPALMESTIFRVIITVIGTVLMLLLGGAATTAICNLTPLCDISFKAVTYLRGKGASNVGRMLSEEITPDRIKRATEFVSNAIRKYKEMQTLTDEKK